MIENTLVLTWVVLSAMLGFFVEAALIAFILVKTYIATKTWFTGLTNVDQPPAL